MGKSTNGRLRRRILSLLYYGSAVLLVLVLFMLATLIGYALLGISNVKPVNIYRAILGDFILLAYSIVITIAYLRKLIDEIPGKQAGEPVPDRLK
jgi:uncharacterized membrane protein